MSKYARVLDNKYYELDEIFPREAIGTVVELLEKKVADFGPGIGKEYYKVKFLDDNVKRYNNQQLAGGGMFDEIFIDNLELIDHLEIRIVRPYRKGDCNE